MSNTFKPVPHIPAKPRGFPQAPKHEDGPPRDAPRISELTGVPMEIQPTYNKDEEGLPDIEAEQQGDEEGDNDPNMDQ